MELRIRATDEEKRALLAAAFAMDPNLYFWEGERRETREIEEILRCCPGYSELILNHQGSGLSLALGSCLEADSISFAEFSFGQLQKVVAVAAENRSPIKMQSIGAFSVELDKSKGTLQVGGISFECREVDKLIEEYQKHRSLGE